MQQGSGGSLDRDGGAPREIEKLEKALAEAEKRLAATEATYRALVEHLPLVTYTSALEEHARTLEISPQIEAILGYSIEEWRADADLFYKILHPDDREAIIEETARQNASGEPARVEYRLIARDGRVVWFLDDSVVERDDRGRLLHARGYMVDISEHKLAEQRLAEAEERYRRLVEEIPVVSYLDEANLDCESIYISPQIEPILGYSPEDWVTDPKLYSKIIHPDDAGRLRDELARSLETGEPLCTEYRMIARDGRVVWFRDEGVLERDENGQPLHVRGYMLDITSRREAEEAIGRRDAILHSVSAAATRLVGAPVEECIDEILGRLGEATGVSRVYLFENEIGADRAVLTSQTHEWVAPGIAPQIDNPSLRLHSVRDAGYVRFEEVLSRGDLIHGNVRDFPASERPLLESQEIKSIAIVPVLVGQEWWGFIGFDECVRERRWSPAEIDALKVVAGILGGAINRARAEKALRRSEVKLRQSLKMEAIGRLAGGIAHDFNNLLTAILGYTELVRGRLEKESPLRRDVEEIRSAAERAASLTRQLLAFGRRQILRPQELDLNAVVSDMEGMLRRLIGEDIELVTSLAPGLGRIRADLGQLQQVILDLAANTRDAMPRGGWLTIETGNVDLDEAYAREHEDVAPGPYVKLVLGDSGHGLEEDVRAHLFEPFFTTRQGEGEGLGLAAVYGIVKQSGGDISVESERGRGTTFTIYLPRIAPKPGPGGGGGGGGGGAEREPLEG